MIDYIFRAYNTVAKKMYYDVQKGISINPYRYVPFDKVLLSGEYIVMQFIGIRDSEHRRIYERDILQTPESKSKEIAYIVAYSKDSARFIFHPFKLNDLDNPFVDITSEAEDWETIKESAKVIGNSCVDRELVGEVN